MNEPKWRNTANFPRSGGSWEILAPLTWYRREGKHRVVRAIGAANPLNPVLISTPETQSRFVAPILVEQDRIANRVRRNLKLSSVIALIFWSIGTLVAYIVVDQAFAVLWFCVFGAVTVQTAHSRWVAESPERLVERWMFFSWCMTQGAWYAIAFLALMLSMGLSQVVLDGWTLERFGLIYERAIQGEFWRVFTAPILHTSAGHWLINTVLGVGLIAVYGPVTGPRVFWVVLLSAIVSFASVLLVDTWWGTGADGIVGLSGGIAGMIGSFLAANIRFARHFPDHFAVTTALLATVTLFVWAYFLNFGGFVAHFAGLACGFALGFVMRPITCSYLDAGSFESVEEVS